MQVRSTARLCTHSACFLSHWLGHGTTFLDEVLAAWSSWLDRDSRLVLRLGTRDISLLIRGDPETWLLLGLRVRGRALLLGLVVPPASPRASQVRNTCVDLSKSKTMAAQGFCTCRAGTNLPWLFDLNDASHPGVCCTRWRLNIRLPAAFL